MKAVCWQGINKVGVERVPDPTLINPRDAIVRITTTCICGSDLHLLDGFIPSMLEGDILGHEFMGEIVELGPKVTNLKKGDRVIVPFTISCGNCFFCKRQLYSCCDNSNPNAYLAEQMYGFATAGLFGYSHLTGGYAGGQAEYARVPFADVGCFKMPDGIPDDKLIFLTDIFPTGYMAAENCDIKKGDVIVVFGCGPVGQFAIRSAFLLGAGRVIAIDNVKERLAMAATGGADVVDEDSTDDMIETIKQMTGGMGPDACIDAVGMEAHGDTLPAIYDRVKSAMFLATDRPNVLRQAIQVCRKGGIVSVPGVYGGVVDKLNFGAAFQKGLSFRMGQTHVHKYVPKLLRHIENGDIDPSFVITHPISIDDAPKMYKTFREKKDKCIKAVIKNAA